MVYVSLHLPVDYGKSSNIPYKDHMMRIVCMIRTVLNEKITNLIKDMCLLTGLGNCLQESLASLPCWVQRSHIPSQSPLLSRWLSCSKGGMCDRSGEGKI